MRSRQTSSNFADTNTTKVHGERRDVIVPGPERIGLCQRVFGFLLPHFFGGVEPIKTKGGKLVMEDLILSIGVFYPIILAGISVLSIIALIAFLFVPFWVFRIRKESILTRRMLAVMVVSQKTHLICSGCNNPVPNDAQSCWNCGLNSRHFGRNGER